jgi:hypothetical protein
MKALIVLQSPAGRRIVLENEPYQLLPDETIVGTEWDLKAKDELDILQAETIDLGIAWGDAIAAITKSVGIKPCSSCEQRRQIMNELKKNGLKKTLTLIKETFKK